MLRGLHPKLLVSFGSGAAIYMIVIGFLVAWHNSFAAASALLGAVIGWVVGIVLAPYSEEKRKFEGWAKGLSGLIAGISISEARNAINALPPESKSALSGASGLQCYFAFLICGLTTAIVVFVARSYWQGTLHPAGDDDEPEARSTAAGRRR